MSEAAPRRFASFTACALVAIAAVTAWQMAFAALDFNDDLAIARPAIARRPPAIVEVAQPRLARRVFLIVVDGLGHAESHLPALDALRARGIDGVAASHYPTVSRPNYVTILSGVPPVASGVRANRVRTPIRVDAIMHRVKDAGGRVDTASDIGGVPKLFSQPADLISDLRALEVMTTADGTQAPPAGFRWPFDVVRVGEDTAELEPRVLDLARGRADLVFVLAGDVDRAGHAHGLGADYRTAARRVDAMIGRLAAAIDLTRDAIVVTADHGHVARGGHGGDEPEVVAVPLVIAGAGVRPGASVVGARLVDVAPTVAALLGIPAPGHGHGRTLIEALRLEPPARDARIAADLVRLRVVADTPPDAPPSPVLPVLAIVALAAGAIVVARVLARRGAVVLGPGTLARVAGATAFVAFLVALFAITRGHLSPSFVPPLWRFQKMIAVCALAAIALQLAASLRALRGHPTRVAAANGIAGIGLAAALLPTALVRAWLATPHLEVPGPAWLVALPGLALATAVAAAASGVLLLVELVRAVLQRGASSHGVRRRDKHPPGTAPST